MKRKHHSDDNEDENLRRARAANAHLQALQFGYEASGTTRESFAVADLDKSRKEEEQLRKKYPYLFPERRRDASAATATTRFVDLAPRDKYLPRSNIHEVRAQDLREQERREQGIMAGVTVVGLSLVIALLHLRLRGKK